VPEKDGVLPVRIVEAGLTDLSAIQHLEEACFAADAYSWGDIVFLLGLGEVIRLKAVVGGQVVGFIAGEPLPRRSMAWIVTLCVLPGFQGRGIGARLLAECECQLAASGIPRSRLRVRVSNAQALALYRRMGYHLVGREANYYSGPEDALVMEKRL
jgi:ribosomal protein S18 acetylase RimI-like enzyme